MINKKFIKQKTREYYKIRAAENHGISKGKQIVVISLVSWLFVRVLMIVVDAIMAMNYYTYEFNVINIASFLISLLFGFFIFKGIRKIAIIPIVGSMLSFIQALIFGYITVMMDNFYDLEDRFYCFLFIFTIIYQAASMLIILNNDCSKLYFSEMMTIKKKVQEESRILNT